MEKEQYKGVMIEYQRDSGGHDDHPPDDHPHNDSPHDDHPVLVVNGKNVHVMRIGHNLYSSHHLPYYTFSSLAELGRALVDGVPLFQEKKGGRKK